MDPTLAEIRMFGGNFAPRGWALCDGQLLSINSNPALFSLLGTIYGGDGRTTFALPDLRGRVPIHPGTGPGLSTHPQGQKSGSEYNILNVTQMPQHNHTATVTVARPASGEEGNSELPAGNVPATVEEGMPYATASDGTMAEAPATMTVANNGGSQSVNNIQPYTVVNYIIALQGLFPSRS